MEKRKRYLIDRKVQFFFVKFIILYLLLISVVFGYVVVRINTYFTDYIVSTISTVPSFAKASPDPQLVHDLTEVLSARDMEFLIFLVLALIVVGFAVAYLTIRFSHRVAGPIYHIRAALDQVLSENYSVRVQLRKGDLLSDFADDVNLLIDKLDKERKH
ncbi:MAG: hypothetical protein Q8Q33_10780 [Chlamydiota bacterium]|nr:hypothetical protein [Chlamydiota bacterium]